VIVEWFLGVLVGLLEGLLSALPSFSPPSWFTDSGGMVGQLFTYADSMGAWLPIGLLMTIAAAVLTCVVIGFAIKLTRIAASFLTAGGGSAG
jgi:hypothetical protein